MKDERKNIQAMFVLLFYFAFFTLLDIVYATDFLFMILDIALFSFIIVAYVYFGFKYMRIRRMTE